ncbi:uncharacterized protein C1orf141 homolog [Hyperolius riggenbachi]|uniref:uncharacterized protein C1orf141 homolog n=1 Tax=Hyperolius riggenbachi TaxID=752182 RepID=UPI0035A271DF
MAQRILGEFDALDKYSQDLLAKHVKKQSMSYLHGLGSLSIPLTFDFELEDEQNRARKLDSIKLPLETQSSSELSQRRVIINDYAKPVVRPFTATSRCTFKEDGARASERRPKKAEKLRCASATRRRSWQREVDSVPNLGIMCQEDAHPPILGFGNVTFLSPRSPVPAENMDDPLWDIHKGNERSPLQDECTGKSSDSTAHDTHRTRQNVTNTNLISLSIEDELKKPDVKVISIRDKTRGKTHPQPERSAKPFPYHHENKFVLLKALPSVQKIATAKRMHFPSSQSPLNRGRCRTGTKPVQQSHTENTDNLINDRTMASSSLAVQNKTHKRSLSAHVKFRMQFLSADGTKQKVEVGKEEEFPTDKLIGVGDLRMAGLQEKKPRPKSVPVREMKAESLHVGPIINGVNPKNLDQETDPGSRSRAMLVSKPYGAISAREPTSRPGSVAETPRWSYITISKPLSPPGNLFSSLQMVSLVSDPPLNLLRDTARPISSRGRHNSPETLTTRSIILENRQAKQSSVPAEKDTELTEVLAEKPGEGHGEDIEKVAGEMSPDNAGTSWTFPVYGHPEGSVTAASEELAQKSPQFTTHHVTIPVISIPTAQSDLSE